MECPRRVINHKDYTVFIGETFKRRVSWMSRKKYSDLYFMYLVSKKNFRSVNFPFETSLKTKNMTRTSFALIIYFFGFSIASILTAFYISTIFSCILTLLSISLLTLWLCILLYNKRTVICSNEGITVTKLKGSKTISKYDIVKISLEIAIDHQPYLRFISFPKKRNGVNYEKVEISIPQENVDFSLLALLLKVLDKWEAIKIEFWGEIYSKEKFIQKYGINDDE